MFKFRIPWKSKENKGSYIGGVLETYQRAGIFVSAIQFLVVVIIFYTTSLQPFLQVRELPWLSFPWYMTIVVTSILLLMIAVKIVVIPSSYTFLNRQMWNNRNPMRKKLEVMEKNLKRLMEKNGLEYIDEK